MGSQRAKFTVGLFVASGIGIAIVAIIWLGMSRFFEKGNYYVTYFNESVQGLDMDSPVKYRGVSIGRVESIGVASDSKLIQVVLKIESGQTLDRNIVAQMKSVGITGIMFIELDQKKKGEPDRSPSLSFPSEYQIVASKPSDISELLQGIDDVLSQIKSLDVEGIGNKVKLTLDHVNQLMNDIGVKGISGRVELTLDSINQVIAAAEIGVKEVSNKLESSLDHLNQVMVDAAIKETSDKINLTLDHLNQVMIDAAIKETFDKVNLTLDNLNQVMVDAAIKETSGKVNLTLDNLN